MKLRLVTKPFLTALSLDRPLAENRVVTMPSGEEAYELSQEDVKGAAADFLKVVQHKLNFTVRYENSSMPHTICSLKLFLF